MRNKKVRKEKYNSFWGFYILVGFMGMAIAMCGLYIQGWRPFPNETQEITSYTDDLYTKAYNEAIKCHGLIETTVEAVCPAQKVKLNTKELNNKEFDRVDLRSAQQAREKGREILAPFCSKHPWFDICN